MTLTETKDLGLKKKVIMAAAEIVTQKERPPAVRGLGRKTSIKEYRVENDTDMDILTVVGAMVKIELNILRMPILASLATIDSGMLINRICIARNRIRLNRSNVDISESVVGEPHKRKNR